MRRWELAAFRRLRGCFCRLRVGLPDSCRVSPLLQQSCACACPAETSSASFNNNNNNNSNNNNINKPSFRVTVSCLRSTRRKFKTCAEDKQLESLISAGTGCVTIVAKAWDLHVDHILEVCMRDTWCFVYNLWNLTDLGGDFKGCEFGFFLCALFWFAPSPRTLLSLGFRAPSRRRPLRGCNGAVSLLPSLSSGCMGLIDFDSPYLPCVLLFFAHKVPREENLAMVRESVEHLKTAGKEVMLDLEHFFDGWKANSEYTMQVSVLSSEYCEPFCCCCGCCAACLFECLIIREPSESFRCPLSSISVRPREQLFVAHVVPLVHTSEEKTRESTR